MAKKTPPYPEYPQWTTARFFSFIRSALRQAWNKWPPKYEALKRASVPYDGPDKRRKKSFRCANCGELFKQTDVQVDHIIECGTLRTFEDIGPFCQRLFVGPEKLQILCKPCHKEKK